MRPTLEAIRTDPRPNSCGVTGRCWRSPAGSSFCRCVLQVRSDDHAAFCFLPDWPIPSSCPSQAIFGVDCPGCGLTRSFIHLAHGDWQRAFSKHRVGWLLALAVVLQIPYRLAALLGRNRQPLGKRFPSSSACVLDRGPDRKLGVADVHVDLADTSSAPHPYHATPLPPVDSFLSPARWGRKRRSRAKWPSAGRTSASPTRGPGS